MTKKFFTGEKVRFQYGDCSRAGTIRTICDNGIDYLIDSNSMVYKIANYNIVKDNDRDKDIIYIDRDIWDTIVSAYHMLHINAKQNDGGALNLNYFDNISKIIQEVSDDNA